MNELAIFGGTPVRDKKIFYGHQYIDDSDIDAVARALKNDLITCGPKIEGLEASLCDLLDVKHAVVVSNGTGALHIACLALGIQSGDEVITTPMTFAASTNCVLYCGGTVVFADINEKTYNIDPDEIERKITPKTKAIIAVDYTGQSVEHDRIRALCDKHGLYVIEDAAHAIGTRYNGKPVGGIADLTTFSFHPVKTVTAGEGGAVTTNSDELFEKLMIYRTHGIVKQAYQFEEPTHGSWYYEQSVLGYNYRLTDFQAALLSNQLKKLEMFSKRRKEIVCRYNEAFSSLEGLIVQQEIPASDTTQHLYVLQLDLDKVSCTRREFFDAMAAENIQCQVHYIPVYYHPYYRKMGFEKGLCPNAERLYERILSIPLYYGLSDEDVEDVISAVRKIIGFYCK